MNVLDIFSLIIDTFDSSFRLSWIFSTIYSLKIDIMYLLSPTVLVNSTTMNLWSLAILLLLSTFSPPEFNLLHFVSPYFSRLCST